MITIVTIFFILLFIYAIICGAYRLLEILGIVDNSMNDNILK